MATKHQAITREFYENLLAAFRKHGNKPTRCARDCGIDVRTARRAYAKGWVTRHKPWAKPMKIVLEEEQLEMRASRVAELERQRAEEEARIEQARKDAKETMDHEALMTRGARIASMLVGSNVLPPLVKAAQKLATDLEAGISAGIIVLQPIQVATLLARVARITKDTVEAQRLALENERLRLGEPTQVFGIKQEVVTADQAKRDLLELVASLGDEVVDEGEDAAQAVVGVKGIAAAQGNGNGAVH